MRLEGRWLRDLGLVHPEVTPSQPETEGAASKEVNLADRVRGQWSTCMSGPLRPVAEFPATQEATVEALEELGVDLAGGRWAEGRAQVDADEVVVAGTGAALVTRHLEPLVEEFAHRHPATWVAAFVHLRLQPCERSMCGLLRRRGFPEVELPTGERIYARVHHSRYEPLVRCSI